MKTFEYLRISVTDRCNLRCIYCMPPEGIPKLGHDQILRYEEIIPIVKAIVSEGVFRVRITGGEPLVRKGIADFIRQLREIPGIQDLALTTNGLLLSESAVQLKSAGLHRINISLDSLRPERFSRITRGGDIRKVLAGIESSIKAGLAPVKLNVVLMQGQNDDEIMDFAQLASSQPIHVRFIERMPFSEKEKMNSFIPQEMVLEKIQERYSLTPDTEKSGGGPAKMFSFQGGSGKVGFISPRSNPYCSECNRLRLTANGFLLPCLDSDYGTSVRGLTPEEIVQVVKDLASHKRAQTKPCAKFDHARCVSLSDIGG